VIVAVIPARGGSKRIPRKNIKNFCGKPLIAYSIEAAKKSRLFDHVVISTDDNEIAEIASNYGGEIPFMRPRELANDHTATVPVISHAIDHFKDIGQMPHWVCCIYPTAPFVRVNDLNGAFDLVQEHEYQYVFTVAPFPSAVHRALERRPDGSMNPLYPEFECARTQDLRSTYFDAGQFYWGSATSWLQGLTIHSHGVGWELPPQIAVDIDTTTDWKYAELMFEVLRKSGQLD